MIRRAFRPASLVLLLALLAGCSLPRAYEAALVLADVAAGDAPSLWKAVTPPPMRMAISYTVGERQYQGDLYLPGRGQPRAGIVLVPGVVRLGNRDPRLVAFARTLARAHFAVLAPAIPSFQDLQVRPADVGLVAAASSYLSSRPDLSPQGRAGIVAFSYAVGLSILAALEPDIRNHVRFILGVGGYYDLMDVITFFTTGYFRVDGHWAHLQADEYGKWVFLESSRPYLRNPQDRAILKTMAQMKLKDSQADIAPLARRLGPKGLAVYRLLTNTNPRRTPALIASLPRSLRALIATLTLNDKDLHRLRAQLILVHGEDDNLVPYTESLALAHALPKGQARVFIIHHVLIHVEMKIARVFSWAFWREDLPDFWRLYRAVYIVLAERAHT